MTDVYDTELRVEDVQEEDETSMASELDMEPESSVSALARTL